MRHIFKQVFSLFLCLLLCTAGLIPAVAANESNTLGVTFSATLDTPTLGTSTTDQQVVLTISASSPVSLDGFSFTITPNSPLTLNAIAGGSGITLSGADFNLTNGYVGWSSPDYENINGVTTLATATITVPANTPAGNYMINVTGFELTKDYGTIWEKGANASATLTVSDGSTPSAGYTTGLSAANTAKVGDTVYVNVTVDKTFAAAELSLTYPTLLLRLDESNSTLNGADYTDANGTLTLVDHGETQAAGTAYTLAFTTIADGSADLALTSAAFSDSESATTEDLTAATLSPASTSVVIAKKSHTVELPSTLSGNTTVEDGADYTFAVINPYYTYTITATMGGSTVTVTDNGNGSYTIANVTGALVISALQVPKTFSVSFSSGSGVILPANGTGTYGTNYSFAMPKQDHYATSITSAKYADGSNVEYTIDASSGIVTIPGTAITQNITIVIDQARADATVTVTGTGASDATGYTVYATPGTAYVLTVNKNSLYQYTVSAAVNGNPVTLTESGNTYTISANDVKAGEIVFTVNKAVLTSGIEVTKYLQLNETALYLIKNVTAKLDGSVYTYGGQAMFWSDEYQAYCTLVVAASMTANDVSASDLALISGNVVEIVYDYDVNRSGMIDANDAQLVYNMYRVDYTGFDANVTIEKFLRADINGDEIISTEDAAAIVARILG